MLRLLIKKKNKNLLQTDITFYRTRVQYFSKRIDQPISQIVFLLYCNQFTVTSCFSSAASKLPT